MIEQERPASTCKRCGQLPGDGTAICDDCRDSRTVAEALLGKKAETPAKQPYVSESGAVHSEAGVSRPGLSVKCAAETPAPTCKRPLCVACGDCPGHDDEPVARDASVNAQECEHGVVTDTADCVTCLIAERDLLRAELDAKHAKLVEVADKLRGERAAHKRTKARARFWKAGARHLHQLRKSDADGYWRDFNHARARVEGYRADKAEAERDAAMAEAAARLELIGDAALFLRSARRHLEGTAVEGTPWFDGLVHLVLVLEEATREPSVLAARVPLLEAVAMAARTLVTWKDNLAFGLNKKRVLDALAALDEKGGGHG